MFPCLHVSISPCLHFSMFPCLHVYVSMFPCLHLHVSMSMCPRFWNFANGKRHSQTTATSVRFLQMENENGKLPFVCCKRKWKTHCLVFFFSKRAHLCFFIHSSNSPLDKYRKTLLVSVNAKNPRLILFLR
jgi:hypothetical protein